MMKKILPIAFFLLSSVALAQHSNSSDSTVFKKIAQSLCPVMSDPDIWKPRDENATFESMNPFDHPKVMESIAKMIYEHRGAFGVSDTLSWDSYQYLLKINGDYWLRDPRIMLYLLRDCKVMLTQMLQLSKNSPSELGTRFREFTSAPIERIDTEIVEMPDSIAPKPATEETYKAVRGKIKRIDTKRYVMVTLEDSTGKTHEFIWFNRFYNSEHLLFNRKKMIGKRVSASGYRQEFLNPRRNDYDDYFVLDNIEFLE